MMNSKILSKLLLSLSLIGFIDAAYLTVSHFMSVIPPCSLAECETVLSSKYADIAGMPIALLGALYYLVLFFLVLTGSNKHFLRLVVVGFIFSMVLLWLQLFVLHAVCIYCMVSIATTTLLLVFGMLLLRSERIKNAI